MTELVDSMQPMTSTERMDVIKEADNVLQRFKNFMEETFPKASSFYEEAKLLYSSVHEMRVHHAKDDEVAAVFQEQDSKWALLLQGANKLCWNIEDQYEQVKSVEDRVKKARAFAGPSRAALGFPTPSQSVARYVYAKQLKYAFHDAKSEVSMMCDYPDGMLVQVRLLHDHAQKLAAPGEKPPGKPHTTVTDEVEATLQYYKEFMEDTYPKASALYERAKWLWQDVKDLRVHKAPDAEIVATLSAQASTWERLEKDAAVIQKSVEKEFRKVIEAEEKMKHARGVYPNVAALGFPTPSQHIARHVYAKNFKYAFHDAKDEYARLCGFPDGILVKIGQVQKYTLQTAGKAAEVEVPPISE